MLQLKHESEHCFDEDINDISYRQFGLYTPQEVENESQVHIDPVDRGNNNVHDVVL